MNRLCTQWSDATASLWLVPTLLLGTLTGVLVDCLIVLRTVRDVAYREAVRT
jgi:hypothetical protein